MLSLFCGLSTTLPITLLPSQTGTSLPRYPWLLSVLFSWNWTVPDPRWPAALSLPAVPAPLRRHSLDCQLFYVTKTVAPLASGYQLHIPIQPLRLGQVTPTSHVAFTQSPPIWSTALAFIHNALHLVSILTYFKTIQYKQ